MVSNPGRRITAPDTVKLTGPGYVKIRLPEDAMNLFKSCRLWPSDFNFFNVFTADDFMQFFTVMLRVVVAGAKDKFICAVLSKLLISPVIK